jgi:hypothetical protein
MPYQTVQGGYGPPKTSSVGKAIGIGCAVLFAAVILMAILCIVAITFLGRNAEQKFSRIDTEIQGP